MAGVAAATALLWSTPALRLGGRAALMLAAALLFGALGAVDDRRAIDARAKLGAGALLSLAVAVVLPPIAAIPLVGGLALPLPAVVGVAGSALWLVTATNAVNFMDGANGLAPGGLLIAFLTLAGGAALGGDAPLAAVALATAAAYAGFLPWNVRGRVFQGDAGALFGGFLFAAGHLAGAAAGALPLLFGPIVLLPWLTDVLLTLARRARARRPLLQAHREHLYQRWLTAHGREHPALARRNALACGAAALAALLAAARPDWQGPAFALTLVACIAGWTAASRRLDAAARR